MYSFQKPTLRTRRPPLTSYQRFSTATSWNSTSNVTLTNNYNDLFNYSVYVAALGTAPTDPTGYYSLFGNSSLEMDASNTNNVSAALSNVFNVNCSAPSGFQNLSMTIKHGAACSCASKCNFNSVLT